MTDLVKRLWKGVADVEQQQEAADSIEALEAQLAAAGRALNRAKYGEPVFSWEVHKAAMADLRDRAEAAEQALALLDHPASDPAPTSSPEAVVKAALEWAADVCDNERHNLNALTSNPPQSAAAVGARNILQHSASDPDTIAAIIKTAEE